MLKTSSSTVRKSVTSTGYAKKQAGTIAKSQALPVGPTEQEVLEYAKWLGLEQSDTDLFWVAKQALSVPIPAPWVQCQTDDGDVFFHNTKTRESVWDHPYDGYYKTVIRRYKSGGLSKEQLVTTVSDPWLLETFDKRESAKKIPSAPASRPSSSEAKDIVPTIETTFNASSSNLAITAFTAPSVAPSPLEVSLLSSDSISDPIVTNLKLIPDIGIQEETLLVGVSSPLPLSRTPPSPETPENIIVPNPPTDSPMHQRVQSERVLIDSLRQELSESQGKISSALAELKDERNKYRDLEISLNQLKTLQIPLQADFPILKSENRRLTEESDLMRSEMKRMREKMVDLEISTQEALRREKRAISDFEKKRSGVISKINQILDEERMTRVRIGGLEESLSSSNTENDKLRIELIEASQRREVKKKGIFTRCFGDKKPDQWEEAQKREISMCPAVSTLRIPHSKIPDLVADLRQALLSPPISRDSDD